MAALHFLFAHLQLGTDYHPHLDKDLFILIFKNTLMICLNIFISQYAWKALKTGWLREITYTHSHTQWY